MSLRCASRVVSSPICAALAPEGHQCRHTRIPHHHVQRKNVQQYNRKSKSNRLTCSSVAYEAPVEEGVNDEAEDFYAILGVVRQQTDAGTKHADSSPESFSAAALFISLPVLRLRDCYAAYR